MTVGEREPRAGHVPLTRAAAALLGLALAVRVAYLRELRRSPLFDGFVLDERNYDAWAQRIAAGDVLGEGTFTANPLAPYLLGALYALFERDLVVVRAVQMLASTAVCWLLYLVARRSFGERPALVTLALAAVYGPMIHTAGSLVAEGWVLLFAAGALAILAGQVSTLRAGAAGGLLALACLGRPNLLPLLAALPVAWAVASRSGWRLFAGRAAAWSLGAALVLGPVFFRNVAVGGEAVLVTAHGGVNLWIGNNPAADGFFSTPERSGLQGGQESLIRSSIAVAERAEHRTLTAADASAWWTQRALVWVVEDPVGWARLTMRKAGYFLNAYEPPLETNFGWAAARFPTLGWATVGAGVVGPLALVGMWATRARWRELGVLHAYTLGCTVTVVLYFVAARYRLPVLVAWLPFAGVGACAVWSGLTSRKVSPGLLLGAAAAVFHLPIPGGHVQEGLAFNEHHVGNILREAGRLEEAVAHYEEAVRLLPTRRSFTNSLARAYLNADRPEAAVALLEASAVTGEDGRLLRALAQGRVQVADHQGAIAALEQALELDPGDERARRERERLLPADPEAPQCAHPVHEWTATPD
jgi:hypothetical protein